MAIELDYDALIPLDAESLAEAGIGEAYAALAPRLGRYVARLPAPLEERIDGNLASYSVVCLGTEYPIYGGNAGPGAWGNATVAFFDLVNRQLADTAHRLFAVNGGDDLGALFLTPEQAENARKALPRRTDWPYLPVLAPPWYGQPY